jgi:small subunit ribosomal protein S4
LARYTGPACRICRREGIKLYFKGDRCYLDKCAIERRPYPPGQHGQGRVKTKDFGIQLREKQKLKRIYGLVENQFRLYFERASRQKGLAGENLLKMLEMRLDNIVYRCGLADSRSDARQLVGHGHVGVNGIRVNIPSVILSENDLIEIREKSKALKRVNKAMEVVKRRGIPPWLEVDTSKMSAKVKYVPTREEMGLAIREQLIVEFYSR